MIMMSITCNLFLLFLGVRGGKMTTAGWSSGRLGGLRLPFAAFVAAILHTLNLMNCLCVCVSCVGFAFNNLAGCGLNGAFKV